MSTPRRLQRRRTRGWRKPPGAVCVDRTSRWGNPFKVTRPGDPVAHAEAVARFRASLTPERIQAARAELGGRDLLCWCAPELPCHADVLLEIANP